MGIKAQKEKKLRDKDYFEVMYRQERKRTMLIILARSIYK